MNIIKKQEDKGRGWITVDNSYHKNQITMDGHLNRKNYRLIHDDSGQKEYTNQTIF